MRVPAASKCIYTLAAELSQDAQHWLPYMAVAPVQVQFSGHSAWEKPQLCVHEIRAWTRPYGMLMLCDFSFLANSPWLSKDLQSPALRFFTPQPRLLLASKWNVSSQDLNRVYTGSGPSCCQTRSPWGMVPWPPSLWDWKMEEVGACEGWCSLAWSPCSPPLGAESQPLEEIEVWRAPKPSGSHRPGSSMWHVVLDVRSCLLGIIVLWFARRWTSVLRKAKAPRTLIPGTGVGCHFLLQGSFTGEEICS